MFTKVCDRSAMPQNKLSLRSILGSTVSVLALSATLLNTSFFLSIGVNKSEAKIIDSVTEDFHQAKRPDYSGAKGKSSCNHLDNVTTSTNNTAYPVRGGKQAFKHQVDRCGERSELEMNKTTIGSTYWYGWSIFIPSDWSDQDAGFDILSQWPAYPTSRKMSCGAVGTYMTRNGSDVIFKLQHQGDSADIDCNFYTLGKISQLRGQWVDFVMQAKWTGNKDGFLKLWMKVGNGSYAQKIDYKGRTFWNDEGSAPYMKMGLYKGDPNFKGPAPRAVYTDEYRLGDSNSSFEEVAPR